MDAFNIKEFIEKNNLKVLDEAKIKKYITSIYQSFVILKNYANPYDMELEFKPNYLKNIFLMYDKLASCVKEDMNHTDSEENIDSHKIAAIFLVCLLKYENIIVVNNKIKSVSSSIKPQYKNTFMDFPVIYFSYILGVTIMESIININSNTKIKYTINGNYGKEFAKLIYGNKNAILTPTGAICNNSIKGIFCLSHIFYFIERTTVKNKI